MTIAVPPRGARRSKTKALPFTAVEFFAGIGLVRLALQNQGWRVLWANDIDPDKAEMYRANFGRDDLVVGDIHHIPASDIPNATLYTASFPCQDLSIAGAMAGLNGKESGAFWGLIRILRDKGDARPPPALQSNGGQDLETALLALNDLR
jgi:DNA (cytosine-5)-methyltransferase 1